MPNPDTIRTISSEESPVWLAVQVRPNHEFNAAALLRSKGYEEFTPSYTQRRRWADRIKESTAALFPGYLFCRSDPRAMQKIVTTSGVIGIVKFDNRPAAIPPEEIESIKIATLNRSTKPWPYLEHGRTVELTEGPLRGARGTVVSVDDSWKLVVSIQLLQRSVAVAIERSWVSVVPDSGRSLARSA